MPSQFKIVGIAGRTQDAKAIDIIKTLIVYLKELNQDFILEENTAIALNNQTAHAIIQDETPILGINRGRLGFLTDIHPEALEQIKAILKGEYILEKRFLLDVTVSLHREILGNDSALNEVALITDILPHMTEFEIYVDDQFLCSQDSDGLIVATPTGSTAYALSGGGPIVHPELDAIVLIPMFPHTLSVRPIVIAGHHRITIIITPNNTASPRVTCDSKKLIPAPPHSRITISKKTQQLHLIHPMHYDYFESLRSKLYWGRKLQYVD